MASPKLKEVYTCVSCSKPNDRPVVTGCGTFCKNCVFSPVLECPQCLLPFACHIKQRNFEAILLYELLKLIEKTPCVNTKKMAEAHTDRYLKSRFQSVIPAEEEVRERLVYMATQRVKQIVATAKWANMWSDRATVLDCFDEKDPLYVQLRQDEKALKAVSAYTGLSVSKLENNRKEKPSLPGPSQTKSFFPGKQSDPRPMQT